MLPHTGLFLLWKVALQMRIRPAFKQTTGIDILGNLTDKIINAVNLMQVGAI